ncbi:flagellar basal body L-ring protein FlgH [Acuticoccus kandeliae]|uniref:flagellar basal body L-ring protein FlgH n=1 Tax=Acuticoccus kandeliae TaxID=2073160 RepID=UPI000D3EA1FD|nr:flagellar basal body L-ring protein FlgH [Acuticoccus kandeliae]
MRRRALLAAGLAGLSLGGCAEGQLLGTPALSPIGDGLTVTRTALPVTIPEPGYGDPTSLYGRRNRDLLTDVRAKNVGDTLTVVIEIDDKAQFDNESERRREADSNFDFSIFGTARGFDGPENSGEAAGNLGIGSNSRYRGTGAIDRSEKLDLSVAVVVTEVLANGNLLISGSQEIRVNDEIRVLTLAGLVNPLDVSRANTVSYEKIAEARISYGGRGRQSEIQSPNWGQQIYDRVVPF